MRFEDYVNNDHQSEQIESALTAAAPCFIVPVASFLFYSVSRCISAFDQHPMVTVAESLLAIFQLQQLSRSETMKECDDDVY